MSAVGAVKTKFRLVRRHQPRSRAAATHSSRAWTQFSPTCRLAHREALVGDFGGMKIHCATAVLALVLLAAQASNAAAVYVSSTTSFQLAQACEDSRGTLEADFCSGYILGAMDQLSATRSICPTGQAITGRALAVVRKYIADHPEAWGQHPLKLVEDGLRFAFPCTNP